MSQDRRVLAPAQVRDIRRLEGTMSQVSIAAQFGVRAMVINDILHGRTYTAPRYYPGRSGRPHGTGGEYVRVEDRLRWNESGAVVSIGRRVFEAVGSPEWVVPRRDERGRFEIAPHTSAYHVVGRNGGTVCRFSIRTQVRVDALGLKAGTYAAVADGTSIIVSDIWIGEDVVSVPDAARQLGITRQRLYQLIDAGTFPRLYSVELRQYVIRRADLANPRSGTRTT